MDDEDKLHILMYLMKRYIPDDTYKTIDKDYEQLTGEGLRE